MKANVAQSNVRRSNGEHKQRRHLHMALCDDVFVHSAHHLIYYFPTLFKSFMETPSRTWETKEALYKCRLRELKKKKKVTHLGIKQARLGQIFLRTSSCLLPSDENN